ncbi:MAG: FdtA/QdtA family cupin domain-containing protein [Prosthecobacter sp.]|nr:FdtA/QdtA family cupin domain-containing protein [Prosthecobacter sp.]
MNATPTSLGDFPTLLHLPTHSNHGRGNLSVAELPDTLPFPVRRCFLVHDVPRGQVRGGHAHRRCAQLMICTHGSCQIETITPRRQQHFLLTTPSHALLVPPGVWLAYQMSGPDACLIVLASCVYEPSDYITTHPQQWDPQPDHRP